MELNSENMGKENSKQGMACFVLGIGGFILLIVSSFGLDFSIIIFFTSFLCGLFSTILGIDLYFSKSDKKSYRDPANIGLSFGIVTFLFSLFLLVLMYLLATSPGS